MPKKERQLEHAIESKLETACIERGWLCPKASSPGKGGFPDRIVITNNGIVVFVEVKRPYEIPRKLQVKQFLKPIAEHDANVVVVSNEEQVDELISQLEQNILPEPENMTSFYIKKKTKSQEE